MSAAGATLAQVIDAVRAGRAVLAPETAGYLVLAIADLLARSPRLVDTQQCGVLVEGGNVVLKPTKQSATPEEAEASARTLFRTLLAVSSGTAPALHVVAGRASVGDLQALVTEIEAALVPVNRAAAKRALSRLARETLRPAATPPVASDAPPPNEDESEVPMQLGRPSWQAAPMPSARPGRPRAKAPPALPIVEDDLVSAIQAARSSMPPRAAEPTRTETPAGVTSSEGITQVDDVTEVEDEPARPPSASPPAAPVEPTPPPDVEPAPVPPTAVVEPSPEPAPAVAPPAQPSPEPAAAVAPPAQPSPEPAAAVVPPAQPSPKPAPAVLEPPRASRTPAPRPTPKTPLPSAANTATPDPTRDSLARILSAASGRPSGPPVRGADELLQSFVANTSRRERDVAADLKRMVGVEPTPPPLPVAEASASDDAAAAPRDGQDRDEASGAELLGSTPPPGLAPAKAASVRPARSRAPYYVLLTLLAAAGAGAFGLWWFDMVPEWVTRQLEPARAPELPAPPPPAPTPDAPKPPPPPSTPAVVLPPPCRATLVLDDVAPGTDVFAKSGAAPLDVPHVPTGANVELLATRAGFPPVRALVPASAAWAVASGVPRYEIAINLHRGAVDAGADPKADAGQPGAPVAAGTPGTVHVMTVPPGAEIWVPVGRGPDVKVDGFGCTGPVDLFLVGATEAGRPQRARLRVDASRFTPDPSGMRTARVSARLAVVQ